MNAWLQLMKRVILTGMYQTLDIDLWLFLHIVITVCDVDCEHALFQCGLPNGVHKFDQFVMLLRQISEECFYLIQRVLHCEESEYSMHVLQNTVETVTQGQVNQRYVLCALFHTLYTINRSIIIMWLYISCHF